MMERNEEVQCLRYFLNNFLLNIFFYLFQIEDAETYEELSKLLERAKKDGHEVIKKMKISLENNNLDEAKSHLIHLRYFISLENSIKDKGRKINVILQK